MKDNLMDFLDAELELDAASFMLRSIQELPECKDSENGFTDKHSPQVFVCIQSIIKCKRALNKSVSKSDKNMLLIARERLRAHFVTLDRDEQIKVLKYVQP